MKLNFWQWLGAILLVLGLVFLIVHRSGESEKKKTPTQPPPATAPAASTVPATTLTSP